MGPAAATARTIRARYRAGVDKVSTVTQKEQLTCQAFLVELLLGECDDRDRRSSVRPVKAATFPRDKWLGDFNFDANPNINPVTVNTLATGDWVRHGQPLSLIGDSGIGESHLLIVDELGYLELDRRGPELLFQALTERAREQLHRDRRPAHL